MAPPRGGGQGDESEPSKSGCLTWIRESTMQQRTAFDDARRRALNQAATTVEQRAMWNVMEKVIHGRDLEEGEGDIADRAAIELDWLEYADPVLLHAWTITDLKLAEFPDAHRVMPTRLGNVMRAAEDQVTLSSDEDLEGFMIRHLDELPPDHHCGARFVPAPPKMYCALMFVSGRTGSPQCCLLLGIQGGLGVAPCHPDPVHRGSMGELQGRGCECAGLRPSTQGSRLMGQEAERWLSGSRSLLSHLEVGVTASIAVPWSGQRGTLRPLRGSLRKHPGSGHRKIPPGGCFTPPTRFGRHDCKNLM